MESSIPQEPIERGELAQVHATLVQSQDNVTWLAFSLAMTTESILLVAFLEVDSTAANFLIPLAGIFLGLVFLNMISRSNADMSFYYTQGSRICPEAFAVPTARRKGYSAHKVMEFALLVWVLGWAVGLILEAASHIG